MSKYCGECGTKTINQVPEFDDSERSVCPACGEIFYNSPTVLVIGILSCGAKMLWHKRAHPPQVGCWLIPMGYVEANETLQEAIVREIREEVTLDVKLRELKLIALGTLVRMNQIHVGFHVALAQEGGVAGVEAQEIGWFTEEEAPWEELAYSDAEPLLRRVYAWLQQGRPASGPSALPEIKEFIVDTPASRSIGSVR